MLRFAGPCFKPFALAWNLTLYATTINQLPTFYTDRMKQNSLPSLHRMHISNFGTRQLFPDQCRYVDHFYVQQNSGRSIFFPHAKSEICPMSPSS